MQTLNRVELIGNVAADPELRVIDGSRKVCSLQLATEQTWRDSQGCKKQRATFHPITIWSESLVEFVMANVKKGSVLHVTGELGHTTIEQGGEMKYLTNIIGRKVQFVEQGAASGAFATAAE